MKNFRSRIRNLNGSSNFILLTFILSVASCSAKNGHGMYKGYEIPSYQIIKKSENIELRQYEKTLVAEVEVEGNREEAAKEGFRTLARYIFGKNTAKEKVAMTSPVNQQELQEESQKISMTSPVNQVKQEGKKWLIQFGMPKTFTIETLPTPKDSRIHFKNIPGKKMAAITFAGSWSDQSFDQNQEKLEKFITENGFKTKGEAIIAYYDDPFTFPWNRRNEVIWEVE